jgi:hypothetical protein
MSIRIYYDNKGLALLLSVLRSLIWPMQKKIEAIKQDWNPLWHIIGNDKCLPTTKRHELSCLHSFKLK